MKPRLTMSARALLFGIVVSVSLPMYGDTLSDLTVQGDAFLKGSVMFGELIDEMGGDGFRVHVEQTSTTVETEVWIEPGEPYEETSWVEEWGWVQNGYYEDVYDWVDVEIWVPAEGYTETVVTGQDEEGNDITEEVWVETSPAYVDRVESQYVWVGSNFVTGDDYWGLLNSYSTSNWVTPEGYLETQSVTSFSAPTVHFTGNRSGTVWQWQNPAEAGGQQVLMKLSNGGLSFPSSLGNGWNQRSLINQREVVLSEVLATTVDSQRQAYGSKMNRDGIEVWGEEGGALEGSDRLSAPAMNSSVTVDHQTVHLERSYRTGTGSSVTKVTRVLPDLAEFGGTVNVKGVLRVQPAGDLSMGMYTSGPRP